MYRCTLLLCLSLGALVKCAAGSDWCYSGCEYSPTHWHEIPHSSCGGNRQSPIDIVTSHVKMDPHLDNFTFVNFSSQRVIKNIINTGHTVKCNLENDQVELSGGGLNGLYSTIQFHFHWGDTKHHPGSEHTVDGHRYSMEMHIVSLKTGLSVEEALNDPEGIAVLGFFINATEDGDMFGPWDSLTSYLVNLTDTDVTLHNISIDDLIGNVDRTRFYRYNGSLTTPNCSEAVVWTVFHEPINVNKKLIERFPVHMKVTNVYRPVQDLGTRHVFASPATPLPPGHSWCYDDHCEYSPSQWHLLPDSQCGGESQSPINIDTKHIVVDEHLDSFTFTKFDDRHAIKSITNTGHAVKCILKDDTVEVSGGGLGHVYSTLQFHFHWGSSSHDSEGSEHTVDSRRYPMAIHIVNKRKDLSLEEAVKTSNGLAVLGFFIEAPDSTKSSSSSSSGHQEAPAPTSSTSDMVAWRKLTNYLSSIKDISSEVEVTEEISIDDLLGNVDRTAYYRYNGSLTTPNCNEAVVWTVFKESVKVDKNLMMLFPSLAGYQDIFRPAQSLRSRTIYASKSAASAPGPIILFLLLSCLCAFSN